MNAEESERITIALTWQETQDLLNSCVENAQHLTRFAKRQNDPEMKQCFLTDAARVLALGNRIDDEAVHHPWQWKTQDPLLQRFQ